MQAPSFRAHELRANAQRPTLTPYRPARWYPSSTLATPSPIRLLALDLDGTTLTSERIPHPANIDAVRRATESGIRVVLASGRIRPAMAPFAEQLGAYGAMVCCNGAHVVDANGNEILARQVDPEVLDIVLDYAVPRELHVNVYTRDELLFLTRSPWASAYAQRVRTLHPRYVDRDEAREKAMLKVTIVDDAGAIPDHVANLAPLIDPELARPTESEPEYLEFMNPKANKGDGLSLLAAHLNIAANETAAIGDYLNDLEMLAWASTSAAVGTGAEAVRLAADVVAPSNDEGAVSWFIDWLLGNGRQ